MQASLAHSARWEYNLFLDPGQRADDYDHWGDAMQHMFALPPMYGAPLSSPRGR
jgi:hypothetical protein